MLVRANYILLLWDTSCCLDEYQPINWAENPSRLPATTAIIIEPSSGDIGEQTTPDQHTTTARSANDLFQTTREYGSVTIASGVLQQVDDGYTNDFVLSTISLSEEEEEEEDDDTIVKSDVVLDKPPVTQNMGLLHNNNHQQDSSISVNDIYHNSSTDMTTNLLNNSNSTYYETESDYNTAVPTIKTDDISSQEVFTQQQQKSLDQQQVASPVFSSSNINSIKQQQNKHSSTNIHNALGKVATRIYPSLHSNNNSVNENGASSGMPVFIVSAASDKLIRSKTVLKRLKTMVIKNKRRLSTNL